MSILVRACGLNEIESFREKYREEMRCQIIYDAVHVRPGWTEEYMLEIDGVAVGYGSVASGGPWNATRSLYEFYVDEANRRHVFDLFAALRTECKARKIETQTNALFLPVMLHTFGQNVHAEAVLFEDRLETRLKPEGAGFRPREYGDVEELKILQLAGSLHGIEI